MAIPAISVARESFILNSEVVDEVSGDNVGSSENHWVYILGTSFLINCLLAVGLLKKPDEPDEVLMH